MRTKELRVKTIKNLDKYKSDLIEHLILDFESKSNGECLLNFDCNSWPKLEHLIIKNNMCKKIEINSNVIKKMTLFYVNNNLHINSNTLKNIYIDIKKPPKNNSLYDTIKLNCENLEKIAISNCSLLSLNFLPNNVSSISLDDIINLLCFDKIFKLKNLTFFNTNYKYFECRSDLVKLDFQKYYLLPKNVQKGVIGLYNYCQLLAKDFNLLNEIFKYEKTFKFIKNDLEISGTYFLYTYHIGNNEYNSFDEFYNIIKNFY